MKPKKKYQRVPPLMQQLKRVIALDELRQLWHQFLPGDYLRKVDPATLLMCVAQAMLMRLPSVNAILERFGYKLKTDAPSTIGFNLCHLNLLQVLMSYLDQLGLLSLKQPPPQRAEPPQRIEIIDSMPMTLSAARQSDCPDFNDTTVGFGVMWILRLDPALGQKPVRLLKILPGAWNDTHQARQVKLEPHGPLYLVDRGFYGLVLLAMWLCQGVHFLMRAKKSEVTIHRIIRYLDQPCILSNGTVIEFDAEVVLGAPSAKTKPQLRLIKAFLNNGEDLFLVSDQMNTPAKDLVKIYRKRETIEKYHEMIKDYIGLAHLYCLQEVGMEVQVILAMLIGVAAYRAARLEKHPGEEVWQVMQAVIQAWRQSKGIMTWKANLTRPKRRQNLGRRHLTPKDAAAAPT